MSTIRHRWLAAVAAVLCSAALAAPPNLIRYQGRLTDDAEIPLTGSHNFDFRIFDALSGGAELWHEGPRSLALQSGALDVLLGEVTPLPSSVFTGASRWLEVTVDGAVLGPRQRLSTVPYAHEASRLEGKLSSEFVDTSATAQVKSGDLSVFDLTLSGNDAIFGAGGFISSNTAGLTVVAGDADADDLSLIAGNSVSDGRLLLEGGGPTELRSGNGVLNFVNGATSVTTAVLDGAGALQIDSDVTISGNDILFGSAGAAVHVTGNGVQWNAGDGDLDDIALAAGNSSDDGQLAINGDGVFEMRSGSGTFQFFNGATALETASLSATGALQIDDDLTVSGGDVSFGFGANIDTDDVGGFIVTAGNVDGDDLFLRAGNSNGDGGLSIFGSGNFLMSAAGTFQFQNTATQQIIALVTSTGSLSVDESLDAGDLSSVGTANTLCSSASSSGTIGRCSSSRRFKEAIEDLAMNGLATVERLRPVEFTWKQSGERDLGFIAEEVADVDPLLAFYDEHGEVMSVKYSQLTALLVKALQEQQKEIDGLRREIEAITERVSRGER